ncbi:uncharacterized protein TNCV_4001001 [Trichonephila clavipes]|nr:uncharacterized protein TNCV_4001001 [Trichonephila clavipes]
MSDRTGNTTRNVRPGRNKKLKFSGNRFTTQNKTEVTSASARKQKTACNGDSHRSKFHVLHFGIGFTICCYMITHKSNDSIPVSNIQNEILPLNRFEIHGDRGTTLGTNIYVQSASLQSKTTDSSPQTIAADSIETDNCQALEEITLLGRLIGKYNQSDYVPEIMLCASEEKEEPYHGAGNKENCSFVGQAELGLISNEFSVTEERKERNDILELLDIAESNGV